MCEYLSMSHWIRQRLKAVGKTQRQLAEQVLHRDPAVVSAIVDGRQQLKLDQLAPVADFLGCSVADLLAGLGISTGQPAVDPALLADCIDAILQKMGASLPCSSDALADLVVTLYERAATRPDMAAPQLDVTADALVAFAARRA